MRNRFVALCLVAILGFSVQGHSEWRGSKILNVLAGTTAMATVTFVYAMTNGAATFVWAFRWNAWANYTDEQNANIQASGGLISAGLTWVLGGFFVFWGFWHNKYIKRMRTDHPDAPQNPMELVEATGR